MAWALTIFLASTRTRIAGPEIEGSDKVVHFFAYGLLASLICRLGRGWRAAAIAALLASAYGATDEWHQYYTPGRSCDFWDWVADTAGALVAVAVYAGWPAYRRLMERRIGPRRPKRPDACPTEPAPSAERSQE